MKTDFKNDRLTFALVMVIAFFAVAAIGLKAPIFQGILSGTPAHGTRVLALADSTSAGGQHAHELTLPQLAQWSDGDALNPQLKKEWLVRGQTDGTASIVLSDSLNGGLGITPPALENSSVIIGHVVGRVGVTSKTRAWETMIVVASDGGVLRIASSTFTQISAEPDTDTWTLSAAINGSKLEITATGGAAQEVMWSGYLTAVSSHFTALLGDRVWDTFINSEYGWDGRELLAYYDGDGDGMPTLQEWAMWGDINNPTATTYQRGLPFTIKIAGEELFVVRVTLRGVAASGNLITGRVYQGWSVLAKQSSDMQTWASAGVFLSDTLESSQAGYEVRLLTVLAPTNAEHTTADVVINCTRADIVKVDGVEVVLPNYPYLLPGDALTLETDLLAAGYPFDVTGTLISVQDYAHSDWVVDTKTWDGVVDWSTINPVTEEVTTGTGQWTKPTVTDRKTLAGIPLAEKHFVKFTITQI